MPSVKQERLAKGQCPQCGKEAAPYYLCYGCRQSVRITRCLKRGARLGAISVMGSGPKALYSIPKGRTDDAKREWGKWSTKVALPETDGRSKPRIRNIRIDVEKTLLNVIGFIGRPCTIGEITEAWGKLRTKRDAPLANDLGRIIVAAEKRSAKLARRAARCSSGAAP